MINIIRKNKNNIILNLMKYSFIFVLVFSFFVSLSNNSLAQGENTEIDTSGIKIETQIKNPIGDKVDSIPTLIKTALEFVVKIGVPIIAFAIIFVGFSFVAAQGNPEKLKKAKDSMLYTLIGAAVILGAFVIAKAIGGTVEQIREGV